MSKTEEMGQAIESDHISELTEEEYDEKYLREDLRLRGFAYIDAKYLVPFFTRRITKRVCGLLLACCSICFLFYFSLL